MGGGWTVIASRQAQPAPDGERPRAADGTRNVLTPSTNLDELWAAILGDDALVDGRRSGLSAEVDSQLSSMLREVGLADPAPRPDRRPAVAESTPWPSPPDAVATPLAHAAPEASPLPTGRRISRRPVWWSGHGRTVWMALAGLGALAILSLGIWSTAWRASATAPAAAARAAEAAVEPATAERGTAERGTAAAVAAGGTATEAAVVAPVAPSPTGAMELGGTAAPAATSAPTHARSDIAASRVVSEPAGPRAVLPPRAPAANEAPAADAVAGASAPADPPAPAATSAPALATTTVVAAGAVEAGPRVTLLAPPLPPVARRTEATRATPTARPARVVWRVAPVYPAAARAAGIGGVVELDVSVDETGRVVKVDAVSGHALLRAAAADAVGRWRYEPALVEGLAVASQGRVTLTFEGR